MEFPKLISSFVLCADMYSFWLPKMTHSIYSLQLFRGKISPSLRHPDKALAITTLHSRLHFKTPSSRKSPHWMWQRILIPESLSFHPPPLTLESNPCVCQTSATPENDWPHSLPAPNGKCAGTDSAVGREGHISEMTGWLFIFADMCIWCPGLFSFVHFHASYARFHQSHLVLWQTNS